MIARQKGNIFNINITCNHNQNNKVKLTAVNSEQKFTKKMKFFVSNQLVKKIDTEVLNVTLIHKTEIMIP